MPLHPVAGVEPIAGYPLVRLLGRGGFGEVWEALAPGGVRVALKFIRLDTDQAGPERRALEVFPRPDSTIVDGANPDPHSDSPLLPIPFLNYTDS